jgi:D-alanyl-lipoteichoic acid acyltransferase DltB (MBOAT superfamily)
MLFQTQFFILVFLPILVITYYAVASWTVARQWVLIAGSLVFYGWWDIRFISLLVGQITASWLLAVLSRRLGTKWPLILGVLVNLSALATFKYLNFLVGIVETASGLTLFHSQIVLPIGISFYSFQLMSYLIDRMRNDAPIYPFRPFALFILLFPHLIAGPIVRHNELVPQFAEDPIRPGLWQRIGTGLFLFTLGVAKKVLLADALAGVSDPLFIAAGKRTLDFGEAWTAALAFSFQLFMDFSAYTEMAIGIALLFGLLLPENFRRPYLAVDIRDFWRRWHISLSNFLRDYLYFPLGGSRHGVSRLAMATMVTMALCGLWHGAGWTYIAWGLWHGFGLLVCRVWGSLKRPMPTALSWLLTMLFVLAGWVLFRAASFSVATAILGSMIGVSGFSGGLQSIGLLTVGALLSVLIPSAHEIKNIHLQPRKGVAAIAAIIVVACLFRVGKSDAVNFIYFQF